MSAEKVNPENISPDPLTRIRNPYTLSPTPKEHGEAEDLVVKHFLQTLAEIALAVASRQGKGVKQ
jgi:hypothetical protein